MGLKDILITVDQTGAGHDRLRLAMALALRHGARLIGTFLLDSIETRWQPLLTPLVTPPLIADFDPDLQRNAAATAEQLENGFFDALASKGLSGDWRVVAGTDGAELWVLARGADLTILGQSSPDDRVPLADAAIEQTLLNSGRPILVTPFIGSPITVARTVLVGWDGGREAARAVHDALPLLRHAETVTVLSVDENRHRTGGPSGAEIASHLARHGVATTAVHTITAGLGISDVLLDYASDIAADLIVVGGYGHSRLQERLLGGATIGLLRHMTVPVFMSH